MLQGEKNLSTILSDLQRQLAYTFGNIALLKQSITHSSYANEKAKLEHTETEDSNNERLEYLGDAVLGLVIAQMLMDRFPSATEGALSKWRSQLVSRKNLSEIAAGMKLGDFLLLGRGELLTGGATKTSILAAAFEAIVAAIYLDGGMDKASQFLRTLFEPLLIPLSNQATLFTCPLDKKTYLQEKTQSLYKITPQYKTIDSWGPEHAKMFRVEISISGKITAHGEGRSKKEAEQSAAEKALEILEGQI